MINQLHNKSQYWAISSEGMHKMLHAKLPEGVDMSAVMANKEDRQFLREHFGMFINQRPEMHVHNGIAEVYLHGPMLSDASPFDLAMGTTAYEEIREEIQLADDDDEVDAIIAVFDTPGGTVEGIEETYEVFKNSTKPIYGYAYNATSAGYYLLCVCENITVSASSSSGNIGTILSYWDLTEVYENMGAKQEVITNEGADLKGTFSRTLSDSQREFVQEMVNEMGEQFQNRVMENREVDPVVFRAGWYSAEKAGALGLVDAMGTMDELRQQILTAK